MLKVRLWYGHLVSHKLYRKLRISKPQDLKEYKDISATCGDVCAHSLICVPNAPRKAKRQTKKLQHVQRTGNEA